MNLRDLNIRGELVAFPATDNAVLCGLVCRPKQKSDTAIIHLHGLNSAFYKPLPIRLGRTLVGQGFTFMSIQQRGSYNEFSLGKNKRNRYSSILAGGCFERFEDCVFDINGAIKYLKSIGIKRIYLQGHSTGCQKSVYYAMKTSDKAVKGLILLAPCDDYNIWKGGIHKLASKNKRAQFGEMVLFAKSKLKSDPSTNMATKYEDVRYSVKRFLSFTDLKNVEARIFNYDSPKMKEFGRVRIPIFAVFGTRDEYLQRSARDYMRILGKNTGSKDFMGLIIKNANHSFVGKEAELSGLISKWVSAQEKGGLHAN